LTDPNRARQVRRAKGRSAKRLQRARANRATIRAARTASSKRQHVRDVECFSAARSNSISRVGALPSSKVLAPRGSRASLGSPHRGVTEKSLRHRKKQIPLV